MLVKYDIENIKGVLQHFYNATGININLLKSDFSPVISNPRIHNNYCRAVQMSEAGKRGCKKSDICLLERCKKSKRTEMSICHAGLIDIAVPILFRDEIVGYIILGQLKNGADFSLVKEKLVGICTELDKMEEYYLQLGFYNEERVQSVASIASILAKYILLEDMLKPSYNDGVEKAVSFIRANIDSRLTVEVISKGINVSKSVLYNNFHTCFGCTVTEYVGAERVEASIYLLNNSNLSIEEIARCVGFSNASYYTRVFKKHKGIAPMKFKKLCKNGEASILNVNNV